MNKKFLSVILFSALMVGTAGTFTSCKDYDDDIEQINNELTGIKTSISELQAKIGEGKFVTNVTKSGDGIVVTWNDNSTSTIETIKGDKGEKGDKVEITIDPTTKNWKIDGVDTGVCAEGKNGSGTNGVNAKSPSISETTGNWVVYEWDAEKQEYVGTDTGISAKGASAYVVDKGNYYELNVAVDKAGSAYTTVKLPKSPATITEIEVLGLLNDKGNGTGSASGKNIEYNYNYIASLSPEMKAWNKEEGVKKLAEKQILSTLDNSKFLIRVAPAQLDASQFSFSLVNSKLVEAPITLGTPEAYNDLLTRAEVSGNGLWSITASAKEGLTYAKETDYTSQLNNILFALQEKDGFATLYDLSFSRKEALELTAKVEKVNGKAVKGSKDIAYVKDDLQKETDLNNISLGDVKITFDEAYAVYDAHLHIDAATIQRWGITNINGTSFTVNKRPDDVTAANFQVQVHYVTLKGEVKSEYLPFKVAKSYANVTELPSKNIEISANNADNKFENSLDPMYTNLGDNVDLWKADVDEATITYQYFNNETNKWEAANNIIATLDKKANQATKIKVELESNITKMELDKPYRVVIDFKDGSEILNTVIQPITFSIPALSHIFSEQPGVFVDGVAYAYMDAKANRVGAAVNATYNLKGAFVELAKKMGISTFNAALDSETKIVGDYKSNVLASLSKTEGIEAADIADWTISLEKVGDNNTNGTQKGYGKELIVNIKNVKYLNVYEYKDEVYTFKISILSPILEGKVTAVNNEVVVPATKQSGYQVNDSHIKGYTYNNEVYSIFSDAKEPEYWKRKEINSVTFATENENIFTCDKTGSNYTENDKTKTYGSVTVYPKNLKETTSANMTVTVKDAWGYTLTQKVKVTVKVGE